MARGKTSQDSDCSLDQGGRVRKSVDVLANNGSLRQVEPFRNVFYA
jgi:hypothetical protein